MKWRSCSSRPSSYCLMLASVLVISISGSVQPTHFPPWGFGKETLSWAIAAMLTDIQWIFSGVYTLSGEARRKNLTELGPKTSPEGSLYSNRLLPWRQSEITPSWNARDRNRPSVVLLHASLIEGDHHPSRSCSASPKPRPRPLSFCYLMGDYLMHGD